MIYLGKLHMTSLGRDHNCDNWKVCMSRTARIGSGTAREGKVNGATRWSHTRPDDESSFINGVSASWLQDCVGLGNDVSCLDSGAWTKHQWVWQFALLRCCVVLWIICLAINHDINRLPSAEIPVNIGSPPKMVAETSWQMVHAYHRAWHDGMGYFSTLVYLAQSHNQPLSMSNK